MRQPGVLAAYSLCGHHARFAIGESLCLEVSYRRCLERRAFRLAGGGDEYMGFVGFVQLHFPAGQDCGSPEQCEQRHHAATPDRLYQRADAGAVGKTGYELF